MEARPIRDILCTTRPARIGNLFKKGVGALAKNFRRLPDGPFVDLAELGQTVVRRMASPSFAAVVIEDRGRNLPVSSRKTRDKSNGFIAEENIVFLKHGRRSHLGVTQAVSCLEGFNCLKDCQTEALTDERNSETGNVVPVFGEPLRGDFDGS